MPTLSPPHRPGIRGLRPTLKRVRGLLALVLASLSFMASRAQATPPSVVYYIPFAVSTYVPVTTATIKCTAWEKWTIQDARQAEHLTHLLSQPGEGQFSEHRVRLFAAIDGQAFYVDQNGTARSGDKIYQVDLKKIQDFRKSLAPTQITSRKAPKPCKTTAP